MLRPGFLEAKDVLPGRQPSWQVSRKSRDWLIEGDVNLA
ncbi:hypothetical protein APTSU1_000789700 [Apodemus speciosus]|uniref:Uncharacterized protein n=1 Tax=Apodemus speciosus TaxID=105296 RepID=A0ABQ0F0T7_APOSI